MGLIYTPIWCKVFNSGITFFIYDTAKPRNRVPSTPPVPLIPFGN